MAEKLTLARIKKFGITFEISVDPDKALAYKKGQITDVNEVLLADHIFSDAHKGQIAADADVMKAFQTRDTTKIADIILKQGEIQLTAEHRAEEREQKRRKLISTIHRLAVDPKTGLPHPATRIEAALEQGKVHVDETKSVEDQLDTVIAKLRPIIPLKIEQKQITVIVPGQYAGKLYNVVHGGGQVLKEDWQNDGSWRVKMELPAGMVPDFIEKLNSLTHGEVVVE